MNAKIFKQNPKGKEQVIIIKMYYWQEKKLLMFQFLKIFGGNFFLFHSEKYKDKPKAFRN